VTGPVRYLPVRYLLDTNILSETWKPKATRA